MPRKGVPLSECDGKSGWTVVSSQDVRLCLKTPVRENCFALQIHRFTMSVQAIAGVSPTLESRIMTEFPSIGATALGRLIGQLLDSVPAKICGVKLSYLIFGLPLAPLGLLLFLLNRLGSRYILTNRSVQIWSTMGSERTSSVDLNDITSVELDELPGQSFFRAADIRLKAASGQTIMVLSGVADAGAFQNAIRGAVQSRRLVQSSLATMNARK